MAYQATVKVLMLSRDDTSGQMTTVKRKDMDFAMRVNNPAEIVPAAKVRFTEQWGPDLVVRCCNLQERAQAILYCMPKESRLQSVAVRDLTAIVPKMRSRTR
jgi:hypothetical protein